MVGLHQQLELCRAATAAAERRYEDLITARTETPIPFFSLTPPQYVALLARLDAAEAEVAVLRIERAEWLVDPAESVRRAWKEQQAKWPGSSPRFRAAIRASAIRGHAWGLTPDEYEPLAAMPCAECGGATGAGIGLDRLDHKRGYFVDNVRPCCGPCNVKRGRTPLSG